jgi:hypothetical protein
MDLVRRYPLVSALAILAGVLVIVLAVEIGSGAVLREKTAGAGTSPAAPVLTKLLPAIAAVNPDQEYRETGERPLFIPTRRPAPALAQTSSVNMAKGQFLLTGVMSAGGMKIALLREKSSGRVVRVEQGKDVNGITVAQIDPEQVTLTQGGDKEVVPLLVSKGAPPPPVAPVAAAGAGPFAPAAEAAPSPAPGANPAARPPVAGAQPGPAQPGTPVPGANPNSLFGPRPGGLTPGNSYIPPSDPTTGTPPTSQAAPLTPEELLARRRARRTQQSQ